MTMQQITSWRTVTEPHVEPISLDQFKLHARIDTTSHTRFSFPAVGGRYYGQ